MKSNPFFKEGALQCSGKTAKDERCKRSEYKEGLCPQHYNKKHGIRSKSPSKKLDSTKLPINTIFASKVGEVNNPKPVQQKKKTSPKKLKSPAVLTEDTLKSLEKTRIENVNLLSNIPKLSNINISPICNIETSTVTDTCTDTVGHKSTDEDQLHIEKPKTLCSDRKMSPRKLLNKMNKLQIHEKLPKHRTKSPKKKKHS